MNGPVVVAMVDKIGHGVCNGGDRGSHDDTGVVDDVMVVRFRGNVCVEITNINHLSDLPFSQFFPENPLAHAQV